MKTVHPVLAILVAGCLGAAACVSPFENQPKQDYEDYLERTAAARGGNGDAAAPRLDVALDSAGTGDGEYFAICMAALSFSSLYRTLRFKATVTQTESPSTLGMQITLLKVNAPNTSEPIGPTFGTTAPIVASVANLDFGNTPDLPAAGNALTQVDFGINTFKMAVVLTAPPERFCSHFSGVTRPSGIKIEGKGKDVCLFIKVHGSTDPTIPTPEEFTTACPLP
jgi:hypothetical protein